MLDRLLALEFFGIKLGLENITRLCDALGNPERSFTAVHVAGTNGKGSVTALVHQALVCAGFRAARYTSPHLNDIRERFVIGTEPVAVEAFEDACAHVLDTADRLVARGALHAPPTFFEATTAIAFELFRRAGVEVAVIEVGLGGRFDATNVLLPVVGAITSIGFDHEKYLGHTLEAIAFEKAGIIKGGMTVVTGALPEDAARVMRQAARDRGATLLPAEGDALVEATADAGVTHLHVRTPAAEYGPVALSLRGDHQVGNALIAIRLLEALAEHGVAVGRPAIEEALAVTRWPARLEMIRWPDGSRALLVDAAHNVEGARALARYLARWYPERPPLVLGLMRDKDVDGILRALLPACGAVVTTAAPTARALPADELAARVSTVSPATDVRVEPDPSAALDAVFAHAPFACVAGSIFLAGAVRDALRARAILR